MTPPLFALGTMHTDRCSPARSISRLARTKAVVTLHGLMNSIHRGDHLDLLPRGALKLQWASLGGMDITFKVPAALRGYTLSTCCKDDRKSSALFLRGWSADAIRTKHILCEYLPGRIRCSVPRAHCLSGLGAHFAMSVNLFCKSLFLCFLNYFNLPRICLMEFALHKFGEGVARMSDLRGQGASTLSCDSAADCCVQQISRLSPPALDSAICSYLHSKNSKRQI